MASLWGTHSHWRKNGYRHQPYSHLVHVHFPPYHGLTHYYLYDPCFLDEYEKIYHGKEKKSDLVFVRLRV